METIDLWVNYKPETYFWWRAQKLKVPLKIDERYSRKFQDHSMSLAWVLMAIYLFNFNNRNTKNKVWNLFKVNNKDIRTTYWWTNFAPCSCVSIVDFKELNAHWKRIILKILTKFKLRVTCVLAKATYRCFFYLKIFLK